MDNSIQHVLDLLHLLDDRIEYLETRVGQNTEQLSIIMEKIESIEHKITTEKKPVFGQKSTDEDVSIQSDNEQHEGMNTLDKNMFTPYGSGYYDNSYYNKEFYERYAYGKTRPPRPPRTPGQSRI